MRRILLLSLLLLALMSVGLASASAAPAQPDSARRIVGYFIEWGIYGRNYLAKNVVTSGSVTKLTTINYAFGNVAPDGSGNITCQLFDPWADYDKPFAATDTVNGAADTWSEPLRGNFKQLKELKLKNPNLKVLISLGGWTGSSHFSDAALPANRVAFVQSCIDLFIKGNLPSVDGAGGPGAGAGVFDGIDIDWEYPGVCGATCNFRPEDKQNFTALLAEFRSQLDAVSPRLLLTIAAPADPEKVTHIQVAQIHQYLNWINLMSYDYHVASEPITNFNSPLYMAPDDPSRSQKFTTNISVGNYLRRGVPPGKLVVGVPFYGHGWAGVPNTNHGLYQTNSGPATGTWEDGTDDYKALKVLVGNGYRRFYSPTAMSAWLYSAKDQVFWTFDDAAVMAQRRAYVDSNRLGGLMFWELSGDTPDGELISALSGR